MTDFRLRLIEMRRAAGLSQRDVSRYFGYATPQFISNWERGKSCPPISLIKKLAKLYKVDALTLFRDLMNEMSCREVEKWKKEYAKSKV